MLGLNVVLASSRQPAGSRLASPFTLAYNDLDVVEAAPERFCRNSTMALIFLDTPQIGLLESIRRRDALRYSSFRNTCGSRGCTLVFTTTQASELRRYPDTSRREGRYRVLADLAPIRTDWCRPENGPSGPAILIHREIFRAIVKRGLVTVTGPGAEQLLERWTDMLPGRLTANDACLLKLFENQVFANLFNSMYDASRFSASAAKQDAQAKKRRVRDFSSEPLTKEDMLAHRERIASASSSLQEQSRLGALPPIPESALPIISNAASEFLSRIEEIGPRAALLERLPVVGLTQAQLQNLTSDELVIRYWFQFVVRTFARDFLHADEGKQEFLAGTLDLADCPGSWLEKRLGSCVRRGCAEPSPNHRYDAERLAYLPYVDLLLTDAEMAEFVRQVRNDESTPARIRDGRPPVAIPTSLDALEKALDSVEAPTSEAAGST